MTLAFRKPRFHHNGFSGASFLFTLPKSLIFITLVFQERYYRDPFGDDNDGFVDEEAPYVGYMYPRTGAYNSSIPSTFIPGEALYNGTHNPYLYNLQNSSELLYDPRRELPISNL